MPCQENTGGRATGQREWHIQSPGVVPGLGCGRNNQEASVAEGKPARCPRGWGQEAGLARPCGRHSFVSTLRAMEVHRRTGTLHLLWAGHQGGQIIRLAESS